MTEAAAKFIYALRCPVTNQPRYIGASVNPQARLDYHLFRARQYFEKVRARGYFIVAPTPKDFWINGLMDSGLLPVLDILEVCPAESADEREEAWIDKFVSEGVYLTNVKRKHHRWAMNTDWYRFWRRHGRR